MHSKALTQRWGALLAATWAAASLGGCGASGDGVASLCNMDPAGHCIHPDAGDASVADHPNVVLPPDGNGVDSGPSRNPLCGVAGCYPGNPSACGATPPTDAAGYQPALADGGDADFDAPTRDAPIDVSTTLDAASPALDASTDVSSDRAVSDGASADGIADGPSDARVSDTGATDEPKTPQSCYIKPSPIGVITECGPIGAGIVGAACSDSADCGAGLACAEVAGAGKCQPFNCALPIECPPKQFYKQVSLYVHGVARSDVKVPVCLPVDNCELLVAPSSCPTGEVCSVVGSEGETTCIPPGSAKLGDTCDETRRCAEGLVCSKLKNQCLKICHIASGVAECPGGTCQGGNRSVPDGFGICVGENPDGG